MQDICQARDNKSTLPKYRIYCCK